MPAAGKTFIAAAAAVALVQYCPAPFLALIPEGIAAGLGAVSGVVGAAAGVAGTVVGGIKGRDVSHRFRRQEQNQQAWSDCHSQLGSATLTFSSPMEGNVLVEGIPPACMTLSTVLTGKYDEGNPVPMGSSSILFQNLSQQDMQDIQNALDSHSSKKI
ncbi:hypothetical protein F5Y17DRAFT_461336 [Xylariaceae sp. FL0594]|nr:hypothetical protein F5Y17DRAFT_461336 [Xylariaceae sp. FL0594]